MRRIHTPCEGMSLAGNPIINVARKELVLHIQENHIEQDTIEFKVELNPL